VKCSIKIFIIFVKQLKNIIMINKAVYLQEVIITDPESGGDVHVSIFKHENGGMFGVDSSYIDQTFDADEDAIIPDVFYIADNADVSVILIGV